MTATSTPCGQPEGPGLWKKSLVILKKIDNGCAFCEKALALLLFSSLVGMICFNVAARNFFQVSYESILELAPTLVVWMMCVGATLALRKDRHIKMELFLKYCSDSVRKYARILVDIFSAGIMVLLFFAAVEFVKNETTIFGARGWLTIIFPVFFALAGFRFFVDIFFHTRPEAGTDIDPAADPSGGKTT